MNKQANFVEALLKIIRKLSIAPDRLSDYVEYVESLEAEEEADVACVNNRLLLEKSWQVIANEFFDPRGNFSQAAWAQQLLHTLKVLSVSRSPGEGTAKDNRGAIC